MAMNEFNDGFSINIKTANIIHGFYCSKDKKYLML